MKIKPIVLAAGLSTRFNGNKLLTIVNEKPMFCHIVDILADLNHKGVLLAPLVVTQYKEIADVLENKGIDFAVNPHPEKGISSSIRIGLENSENTDFYMFFTSDQPYLKLETVEGFIKKFAESKMKLGCVYNNHVWGNPTIFNSNYKDKLLALEGDIGGKTILKKHADRVFLYSVDALELYDIDMLSDL